MIGDKNIDTEGKRQSKKEKEDEDEVSENAVQRYQD